MANEHYEEEGHEEGEYHFSDDQINYDMEMNPSAKEAAAAVATSPKESIAKKLSQHRRIVIGLLVFIVLLGIVYKLVSPSSTPVTDFQPGPSAPSSAPASMPVNKPVVMPPAPVITQPQVPEQPAVQTTVTTTTNQPVQQAPVVSQQTAPQQAAPAAQPSSVATTTTVSTTPAAQTDRNLTERIGTLEQQSTEIMSLMQTQYAQKIADTELQNTQLKAQVQELTSRISNMEVAFRQLTKMLRSNAAPAASASSTRVVTSVPQAARVIQPRNAYTVQAIIPGRAWLKSDSGDTVTVAEGDILKGYGRITRIDPYDGVVDIDTGNRVVSLSYGMTGD
jgi:hypothetical protein